MSEQEGEYAEQTLTPERAYQLTENQGLKGVEVAKMYDVTPSYVSQQKNSFEKGMEKGRESVGLDDFEKDRIEDYLEDKKEPEDEYECPNCPTTFEYMEYEECPNCETILPWDKV